MTIIENVYRISNNEFFEKNYRKKLAVKNTICKIAKKTFSFLYQNRYTISTIACTSLFVQINAAASSIVLPEFLNDLQNCTEAFCSYFNKTDTHPFSFCFSPCCNRRPGMEIFSSLEGCTNSLIALYSRYKQTYWNEICPPVDIEYFANDLNERMHQCFSELCLGDDFINFMNESVFDWCPLKEITNLTRTLKNLTENIVSIGNPQWNKEDILDMIGTFFIDLTKNAQSLLAPIISSEKLLTPALSPTQDFDLIKQGISKMLSGSINLMKGVLKIESNTNDLEVSEVLQDISEKLEKVLNFAE